MEQLLWKMFEHDGKIGTYLFYKALQNTPEENTADIADIKNEAKGLTGLVMDNQNWNTPYLDVNESV